MKRSACEFGSSPRGIPVVLSCRLERFRIHLVRRPTQRAIPSGRGWTCAVAFCVGLILCVGFPRHLTAQTAQEVNATWTLIPSGLAVGGSFRLLFMTSTRQDPTETQLETYDALVQAAANSGHADIRDYSSHFKVLGSNASVNARDHTSTTSTDTDPRRADLLAEWRQGRGQLQRLLRRQLGLERAARPRADLRFRGRQKSSQGRPATARRTPPSISARTERGSESLRNPEGKSTPGADPVAGIFASTGFQECSRCPQY